MVSYTRMYETDRYAYTCASLCELVFRLHWSLGTASEMQIIWKALGGTIYIDK